MTPGSTSFALDDDGLIVGRADAIYTFTGRTIRPLDPDPDDIAIEDIAHSLSQQCRFTGHTREFYSVAEHSILVARLVEPKYRLEALLHDASEAYLADIARPVKKAPGFTETYRKYESRLEHAIQARFSLPRGAMSVEVKAADERMFGIEVHTFMPKAFADAYGLLPVAHTNCYPQGWRPLLAEAMFLEDFYAYRYRHQERA